MPQYQRLRELLEKEKFPLEFTFKFVGKNTPAFQDGTRQLESNHSELVPGSRQDSQNKNHLSVTYSLRAKSADQIIEVFRAISKIPDVLVIL